MLAELQIWLERLRGRCRSQTELRVLKSFVLLSCEFSVLNRARSIDFRNARERRAIKSREKCTPKHSRHSGDGPIYRRPYVIFKRTSVERFLSANIKTFLNFSRAACSIKRKLLRTKNVSDDFPPLPETKFYLTRIIFHAVCAPPEIKSRAPSAWVLVTFYRSRFMCPLSLSRIKSY